MGSILVSFAFAARFLRIASISGCTSTASTFPSRSDALADSHAEVAHTRAYVGHDHPGLMPILSSAVSGSSSISRSDRSNHSAPPIPMTDAIRLPVIGCSDCANRVAAARAARRSCFEYMAELQ